MNVPLKMLFNNNNNNNNKKDAIFSVTFSIWLLLCCFCLPSAEPLVVPQELPSILSLVYSNIPPIKKGTDSRLGFGFRLGNHADFQVLVELGPQKNTRPIGEKTDSENSFQKRQISKAQRDYLRRKQVQEAIKILNSRTVAETATPTERTAAASWLETWSNAMNSQSNLNTKSNNNDNGKKKYSSTYKQADLKKQYQPVQATPPPSGEEQSMIQLQKLYKMATTTATNTEDARTVLTPIEASADNDETQSGTTEPLQRQRPRPSFVPFKGGALYLESPTAFTSRPPEGLALQTISGQQTEKKSKSEITKELMDVSLENEK